MSSIRTKMMEGFVAADAESEINKRQGTINRFTLLLTQFDHKSCKKYQKITGQVVMIAKAEFRI